MKKLLFLFLLLLLPLIFFSFRASQNLNASWDRKDIFVADLTGDLNWHTAINEAMEEWNKGLEDFQLVWNTKKTASCSKHTDGLIVVCPAKNLASNLLGNADRDWKHSRIVSTIITVRIESSKKVAISCHELGHAIGLKHREQSASCMAQFIVDNYRPDMLDFKIANSIHNFGK